MIFKKIGFFGLGLIGGSIAKTIKSRFPETALYATAGHKETIEAAAKDGVIENTEPLPTTAFTDCDLIFLCAPVLTNIAILKELASLPLKDGICITDVGSVKGTIHKEARALGLTRCFIGGHPMAGSEKTGYDYASPQLIENAYYLITPEKDVPEDMVTGFTELVKGIGCIPLCLDQSSHDHSTAGISHLPHVIAAGLVNLVRDEDDPEETMKRIAAGGFRDITRIASSSPEMWENILLSNREAVLSLMDRYSAVLSGIREKIEASDGEGIRSFFQQAKDYRDSLTVRKSSHSHIHELFLDLDDKEGQIALLTTILAISHINIRNIGILHNREFEQGVLHIEFYDEPSREKAAEVLRNYSYTVYDR